MLAGLVRRPGYYNPFLYPERACQRGKLVLALMHANGYLGESEYREAAATPVRIAPTSESGSPYFLALLNNELRARLGDKAWHNRQVYSTLDPQLQEAAQWAVRTGIHAARGGQDRDIARWPVCRVH